jgi:hypothetical protein
MAGVLDRIRNGVVRHAAMWPEDRLPAKARTRSTELAAPLPPPRVNASVATSTSIVPVSTFGLPSTLYDRSTAMRLATVARARAVHVSVISVLPIRYWARTADPLADDRQLELLDWMSRPDPNETLAYSIGWTVDDLFFHGRGFWRIRERYTTGFPSAFQWMPFMECNPQYSRDLTALQSVEWRGVRYSIEDVVEFRGTIDGLLSIGSDVITTAMKAERAAQRFADFKMPPGTINIPGDPGAEPPSTDELNEMGDNFDNRRESASTAVLYNAEYSNPDWDAEKMALPTARDHSALDLSRLANVPPWLTGAPQGATMTYQNAAQARRDLVDFGSSGYMAVITQTLSGPNVTPPGTYIDFDVEGWLALASDLNLGKRIPTKPVQP